MLCFLLVNNNNIKEFIYCYLSIGEPDSTFAVLRPGIQLEKLSRVMELWKEKSHYNLFSLRLRPSVVYPC
jgi:hypothetical protein